MYVVKGCRRSKIRWAECNFIRNGAVDERRAGASISRCLYMKKNALSYALNFHKACCTVMMPCPERNPAALRCGVVCYTVLWCVVICCAVLCCAIQCCGV